MSEKKQTLYVLTTEDGDRIDHLLGVLSVAVSELLSAKRIKVPQTPEWLPAENQLYDERNEIGRELTQSGDCDY